MDNRNVYEILEERGYLAQCSHPNEVKELLSKPGVYFYTGIDPTADSMHAGHFIQMMVASHMQKAGHKPIMLMGGMTGLIGDPSGRNDLRKVLTKETVEHNVNQIKKQLMKFIDFSDDKAILVNNIDWLLDLNYFEFVREYGVCFTVNRMLAAECYKARLESGLTFLEFSYMLMQAFDFLVLNQKYNCQLEMGGDDQWSNILAGIDLIRRKNNKEAYGLTWNLLTTSEGIKMGKTANGALWLDPTKCKPFDFYQYWRNVADADVIRCLKLVTFVEMDEIRAYEQLEGAEINEAKKRLAFEVTKLVHGEEEAKRCEQQALDLFGGKGKSDNMETFSLSRSEVEAGLNVLDVLVSVKILPSKGEGRRLIDQKGLFINDVAVNEFTRQFAPADFIDNELILRKGKKKYYRFVLD